MDHQKRSQDLFLASLDKAMDTFSSSVRIVVYFELKKSFGITREEIPKNPDAFSLTLEKIFGESASVIKRAVIKELEASTGVRELGGKDLATAMRAAYHKQLEEEI